MSSQCWLPLESNPEVMTKFVRSLGMKQSWQFGDVYGLDPDMLGMVPRPVCAVLLLFPITEKYEAFKQEEEERLKSQQQEVSTDVYFMRQTIGNACGTIGLIHAVANNLARLEFEPNSVLKKFLELTCQMSPQERSAFLENDESIRITHESSAQEGQTEMGVNLSPFFTGKLQKILSLRTLRRFVRPSWPGTRRRSASPSSPSPKILTEVIP
ncbi:ubiquitin carboxyl-terminal hydrolase isozyme L3 isoform X2 [Phyllopteryx taeniolatus]|uniref:ubiquitin carboxyl-terminal hydrolase isozyme L3 isoform X2 n=1 Tax=Phyllopteryx taeniolatus TaxID=161469 RepID=UPI002AD2A4DE|nr:ubiquitin carboxyl-terminal hydrolase isozyme L3 isoform X2 [Phyllopteryx taeniolatus]